MLTRWDPYREMMSMRRAMDRLIEGSLGDEINGQSNQWGLALDVVEDEDAYVVKASVPGINPDDLDITYSKGVLTIQGETRDESETAKGQYHLRERRFGSFSRSVSLPATIEADKIEANYQDGVLTLTLPKAEEVKPKRISIRADQEQRAINAN
jgi:HSP20 family protein